MRSFLLICSFLFITVVIISCQKKASENDYYTSAYQYMEQQNWEKAEEHFQKVYDEFPDGLHTAQVVFMIGFINANNLNNLEKAKQYYTKFLEEYPEHDLADDAQYELDNLGKSADDLPFLREEQTEVSDKSNKNDQKISSAKK